MSALLEARNVTKIFGGGFLTKGIGLVALNNLSLTIAEAPPTITASQHRTQFPEETKTTWVSMRGPGNNGNDPAH